MEFDIKVIMTYFNGFIKFSKLILFDLQALLHYLFKISFVYCINKYKVNNNCILAQPTVKYPSKTYADIASLYM